MQTMNALVRISGSREMTVAVRNVTPAEALLLMHVHDADTKDVFESAVISQDVQRSKTDERARLHEAYPQQAKLIDQLFPGRNAADIPETFGELEDVPLEVATEARKVKAVGKHQAEVMEADPGENQAFPSKESNIKAKVKAVMGGE